MLLRGFGVAKHLDEHEAGAIRGILQHLEANHTGLMNAVAGVLDAGGAKRLYGFGFYMHVNVGDEHAWVDFNMVLQPSAQVFAGRQPIMPCPYFEPIEIAETGEDRSIRLPLLAEYSGRCHAGSGTAIPPETLRFCCNRGYSRGLCDRYPADERRSALRYHLNGRTASTLRVLCIEEENYAPLRWYEVSVSIAEGRVEPEIDNDCIRAQVVAFCRGWLDRFAAES